MLNFKLKNLFLFSFYILVRISVNLIILVHIKKFRESNKILVNLGSFGHSILDTTAFFSVYGLKSICISVGSSYDRNKYFKELYKPNILIHYWLPRIKSHKVNLRVTTSLNIIKSIEKSLLIRVINSKIRFCCDQFDAVDQAAKQVLINDYAVPENKAHNLIKKFKDEFTNSGNINNSSLQLLVSNKNRQIVNLSPRMCRLSSKFNKTTHRLRAVYKTDKINVCTLILRKSEKSWSGLGIDSYINIIKYLNEKNYIVHAIGDVKKVNFIKKEFNLMNVYTHTDYGINEKLFQILSVLNADFCFGDPSGAQTLPHFFDKKNLIINAISIGQLHYNSVLLPKIWCGQDGSKASVELHFTDFLFRQSPLKLPNNIIFQPHINSEELVLATLNLFLITIRENTEIQSSNLIWKKFTDFDCLINFASKTDYSPLYFSALK
jgi:putative glycosyltransferase (TIGR04372 family)